MTERTKKARRTCAQVTLTVHEAKRIIAKGIAQLDCVQEALKSGKIFLKGGTTVSAVSEELVGRPMRISGRITPAGAKAAQTVTQGFHSVLIHSDKVIDVDARLDETVNELQADDVAVLGANAIDVHGNAALMYGAPLGGGPRRPRREVARRSASRRERVGQLPVATRRVPAASVEPRYSGARARCRRIGSSPFRSVAEGRCFGCPAKLVLGLD